MNREKMIFAAIGGVSFVGLAVVGWLLFAAFGERGEASDGFDAQCATRARLAGSKIPLTDASLAQLKSNAANYADWLDAATKRAARGDRQASTNLTSASFKQRLVDEAFELRRLVVADAPLVKEDFAFGFADYITGGKIPDASSLPTLERQWTDVRFLTTLLSRCGVTELTGVTVEEKKASEPAKKEQKKSAKKSKADKKKGVKNAKAAETDEEPAVTTETYELRIKAKPLALVRVLNALASDDRFTVVDGFSFARPNDQILSALGGEAKKEATERPVATGRRRPGRKTEVQEGEEAEEAKAKVGFAVDAEREAPFDVTLRLTVYDFGRPEAEAADKADGEAGDETVEAEKNEEVEK